MLLLEANCVVLKDNTTTANGLHSNNNDRAKEAVDDERNVRRMVVTIRKRQKKGGEAWNGKGKLAWYYLLLGNTERPEDSFYLWLHKLRKTRFNNEGSGNQSA